MENGGFVSNVMTTIALTVHSLFLVARYYWCSVALGLAPPVHNHIGTERVLTLPFVLIEVSCKFQQNPVLLHAIRLDQPENYFFRMPVTPVASQKTGRRISVERYLTVEFGIVNVYSGSSPSASC